MKKFVNFWHKKSLVNDLVLLCEQQNNQHQHHSHHQQQQQQPQQHPHHQQQHQRQQYQHQEQQHQRQQQQHQQQQLELRGRRPATIRATPTAPELDPIRTTHAMIRRNSGLVATNHTNAGASRFLEVPLTERRRHSKEMRRNSRDATKRRNSRKQSKFTVQRPECPICFEAFTSASKIFQCDEGHLYCEDCKKNFRKLECPQCRIPLTKKGLRNRFVESLLRV